MRFIYFIYKKWLIARIKLYKEKEELVKLQNDLAQKTQTRKQKETSKLVLWFMLILLLSIVFFTGYVTLYMMNIIAVTGGMMDFTPLVALISAIVGQVVITLGYFVKSTKENSEGGVTYLNAQHQLDNEYSYQETDCTGGME